DHPGGIHSSDALMPTAEQIARHKRQRNLILRAPLIEDVYSFDANHAVAGATFDPARDPFLLSHLDEGIPLFPAVMGIEMCFEAAQILTEGGVPVEICDFQLLNGLRMGVSAPHHATVQLDVVEDGIHCRLNGDFYDKQGRFAEPQRPYQSATLRLGNKV